MTTAPDPIDLSVGLRIRSRRRILGLSQSALARGIGLTFQQVQKYESGLNRVSASMLVKIARNLDTTVASLVGDLEPQVNDAGEAASLGAPGAFELLEAFTKISDTNVRKAVVRLVRAMAQAGVEAGSDWDNLAARAAEPDPRSGL